MLEAEIMMNRNDINLLTKFFRKHHKYINDVKTLRLFYTMWLSYYAKTSFNTIELFKKNQNNEELKKNLIDLEVVGYQISEFLSEYLSEEQKNFCRNIKGKNIFQICLTYGQIFLKEKTKNSASNKPISERRIFSALFGKSKIKLENDEQEKKRLSAMISKFLNALNELLTVALFTCIFLTVISFLFYTMVFDILFFLGCIFVACILGLMLPRYLFEQLANEDSKKTNKGKIDDDSRELEKSVEEYQQEINGLNLNSVEVKNLAVAL